MGEQKRIKCLIWDLDKTLWQGVLSEDGNTALREGVLETIKCLDSRGILQSIASKNEPEPALRALEKLGISEYFLCPQISWNDKSVGVAAILELLNLKPEAVAFIDDNPFERDAVQFAQPKVSVYPETAAASLCELPEFTPRFVTADAARRRSMYAADLQRRVAQQDFTGTNEDFLETLHIRLDIAPVDASALQRVEELTVRTHQLNSTGYTYSYEELVALSNSPKYIFLVCGMRDDYGDNGKVGLLLLEKGEEVLTLKLLIVSCRVMSYGIGNALLTYAIRLADSLGLRLRAEFFQTEHNRIMYITYKFAGFEEIEADGDRFLLEYQGEGVPDYPPYLHWEESPKKAET